MFVSLNSCSFHIHWGPGWELLRVIMITFAYVLSKNLGTKKGSQRCPTPAYLSIMYLRSINVPFAQRVSAPGQTKCPQIGSADIKT